VFTASLITPKERPLSAAVALADLVVSSYPADAD